MPRVPKSDVLPLACHEIEEFLRYVFGDVARRPQRILLREGAGVARYLKALAANLPPGSHRTRIARLSERTWETVFGVSPIEMAAKAEVVRFLRLHERTHFVDYDIRLAVKDVEDTPRPVPPQGMFQPPNLLSGGMSVHGEGTPQLESDLSERIYAAYWALRFSRMPNARGKVAEALNNNGLAMHTRAGRATHWEGAQVADRAKQYEAKLIRMSAQPASEDRRMRTRVNIAERWVGQFRRVRDYLLTTADNIGPDIKI